MRHLGFAFLVCLALPAFGQPLVEVAKPGVKQAAMAARDRAQSGFGLRAAGDTRGITVFTGDRVIPQVADGSGWQTTMTFVNFKTSTNQFEVFFFTDNGNDMFVDLPGIGVTDAITVRLPPDQAVTIQTRGTAGALNQGWAYINSVETNLDVGSLTVFRQRVAGRPDFEAVVPTANEFDRRFVVTYNNTSGYTTAVAIANPYTTGSTVDVIARDEDGNILVRETFSLPALNKLAIVFPTRWPATQGRRGFIDFRTSSAGMGGVGLVFNSGGAFTSSHPLTNARWVGQ